MKKLILFFGLLAFSLSTGAQNEIIPGIVKFYYYKTSDDFFNRKKDSLQGDDMEYNYGKISYLDKKTGKKVKYHLNKDSSYFAFQIAMCKNGASFPLFAITENQKSYGVYFGGTPNLFLILYSRGNFNSVTYDKENYAVYYYGSVDDFGYNLVFTKRNFKSKNNGDIEYFIKDNESLYNKYLKEREEASTYNWNKNFISFQLKYLRAYNR